MSGVATAIVGGSIVTGYMSKESQEKASKRASEAQERSAELGIEEQRRQFDKLQELLSPYITAGTEALTGLAPYAEAGESSLNKQLALAGALGPEAQQAEIQNIESSPNLLSRLRQAEEALLQNAAATGGLRGGNIQAALAEFRPSMIQSEIDKQYSRLGGLTALGQSTTQNVAQLGQSSAAGQASAGMQSAGAISNLLGQQGAAQAGSALAQGKANAEMWGNIGGTLGSIGTLKLMGAF